MFDRDTKLFFIISAIALAVVIYLSSGGNAFSNQKSDESFELKVHKVVSVYNDTVYHVVETGTNDNDEVVMYTMELSTNVQGKHGEKPKEGFETEFSKLNEEIGSHYMAGFHLANGRYILETTGFKENIQNAQNLIDMFGMKDIDLGKVHEIIISREHERVPLGSAQLSFIGADNQPIIMMEIYCTVDTPNRFVIANTPEQQVEQTPVEEVTE